MNILLRVPGITSFTSIDDREDREVFPFLIHSWIMLFLIVIALPQAVHSQGAVKISTGLKPLTELGQELYKGYSGGLYSQGLNTRPSAHNTAGREMALSIQPLDRDGIPNAQNGKIVLLSIGMSNTTQEFSVFKSIADAETVKNPKVVIVDGAQGGQTASIIINQAALYWTVIDQRLTNAGVTRQQVQIAWIKQADAGPTRGFPAYAQTLQSELDSIACILKFKYPNIKLSYWSSRIYGGYATTLLNPEPYAYESGFSVKWAIEQQINGDPSLSFRGSSAKAPWMAWGPYLWADGTIPRSDGLVWVVNDFVADGTHPSSSGQQKVAQLLLNFFKKDSTASIWFTRSFTMAFPSDQELPLNFSLEQNYPNPFNPSTMISYQIPVTGDISLSVYNQHGERILTLVEGRQSAGTHRLTWNASGFSTGIYYCQLKTGTYQNTRKLLLLR
ncbi:MAG: T9SS type A sorting domain-containing protein [bacterium]